VCLNSFVMEVVSLPVDVNVAQGRSAGFFSGVVEGVAVKVFGGGMGRHCCGGCCG
jgi:hypothetical protein